MVGLPTLFHSEEFLLVASPPPPFPLPTGRLNFETFSSRSVLSLNPELPKLAVSYRLRVSAAHKSQKRGKRRHSAVVDKGQDHCRIISPCVLFAFRKKHGIILSVE